MNHVMEALLSLNANNIKNDEALLKLCKELANTITSLTDAVTDLQHEVLHLKEHQAVLERRADALLQTFYTHFDQENKQ